METRAPFVLIGAFVLAAIVAVFGFVYWLNNTGGLGPRTLYRVQFDGPVPGLLVGAGVLFNGIRVGEVTDLSLSADNPRQVNATISVGTTTPVRADTKVGLDFQGLTGVPVIALEGGSRPMPAGERSVLVAEPGAGQSMTQAARDALRRVDTVLSENSGPLKDTIANFKVFSESLARNSGKLDGIVTGIEKMTGAGGTPQKVTWDLRALQPPPPRDKDLKPLAIPEPTAVAMLQTQRMLFAPVGDYPAFAEFLWADSLPKLLQARLIDSFENYDIAHAPLRNADFGGQADHQLLIDVRRFRIDTEGGKAADIALSARLVDKGGKVLASRLIEDRQPIDRLEPGPAVAAFDAAFGRIARQLILWTVQTL